MEPDDIEMKKCDKCGFLQHDSHVRCLKCKNENFSIIKASGACKLLTYTILKATPMEFRDKGSYALGVVEFENGIKVLGQISTEENLRIGMMLTPIKRKICDNLDNQEVQAFIFEPIN